MVSHWAFYLFSEFFSLLKTMSGSVRILLGNPLAALYSTKHSITLSVVGIGETSVFGHAEPLCTDINKYFYRLFAF